MRVTKARLAEHVKRIERRITRLEAGRAAALRAIVRAETALPALIKQLERLRRRTKLAPVMTPEQNEEQLDAPVQELPPHPANIETSMLYGKTQAMGAVTDDLAVPEFLQRDAIAQRDKQLADELRAEQDKLKKLKANARIQTMLAKKSGATRAMPLQGRDALKLIREQR